MRILYAAGRGKDLHVLFEFRAATANAGHKIDILNMPYDTDDLQEKISVHPHIKYDWWIGISLGASILCYMTDFVPENVLPCRITAINPFFDRRELSLEKGFSLENQWDFSLDKVKTSIEIFDVVISMKDKSIPMHHGIQLLNSFNAAKKRLITVEADHQITNRKAQTELAALLLELEKKEDTDFESYNTCHVYQRL